MIDRTASSQRNSAGLYSGVIARVTEKTNEGGQSIAKQDNGEVVEQAINSLTENGIGTSDRC